MYPSKTKTVKNPYAKLHALSRNIAALHAVEQLLDWDQETYMPSEAIAVRSLQIELCASLTHKQKTSPTFAKTLAQLVDIDSGEIRAKELSSPQRAAVREWRRDYLKMVKLPSSFVKSVAKTASTAIHAWAEAKEKSSFRLFAPHLEKIVTLSRKKAEHLGYKEHPYDALLDFYEPEMTVSYLDPLFSRLKTTLTKLVQEIRTKPAISQECLKGEFAPEKQLAFSHQLLRAMGFDPKSSRLDLSNHPFCSGVHPKDIRMTTRIYPSNLMSNIFSTMHEGGHGLYSMNFQPEEFGSPLARSISLGVDESQSRWWETRIGRSLPFWRHFFPILQKQFPETLSRVSLEEFYRAANVVKPSFIRIEADEVTYSLHIIVRFEIEKALLEGSLRVKDLPAAWNAKMQEYFGITPKTDAEGCLQDIHWSMGGFGYFPTYTLGNLYASQFFQAFAKTHPNWEERVAHGELDFIREWLRVNIHQYGQQFTAAETIQRISGSPLSEACFVEYLTKKYSELYNLRPIHKSASRANHEEK